MRPTRRRRGVPPKLQEAGRATLRFVRWLFRGPRRDPGSRGGFLARALSAAARLAVGFALASVISVAVLRFVPPVTTAFILRERAFGDVPVSHEWTPWRDISPHAGLAVVASEDQLFPEHGGFDLEQIQQAMEEGARRGASTISQQTAKNLYLWPGGGYFRKGIEAGFTVLIETVWPKRRILEVYLNVAEFGPGVFGVGEAARLYFGKEAADLTPTEAARLAAVLPSPKRMSARNPSPYVQRRTREILRQMELLGGTAYLQELR